MKTIYIPNNLFTGPEFAFGWRPSLSYTLCTDPATTVESRNLVSNYSLHTGPKLMLNDDIYCLNLCTGSKTASGWWSFLSNSLLDLPVSNN